MRTALISPYCDKLVMPMASEARGAELRAASSAWPSWDLTAHQLADLELLLGGALSPLCTYLGHRDYERVLAEQLLADGTFWPWPIVLDLPEPFAGKLEPGVMLALRDPEGIMLAALTVEERWKPDKTHEAKELFGTSDGKHPGVQHVVGQRHPIYVAGKLEGLRLPTHYDFRMLRSTPAETRGELGKRGWSRVLAYDATRPIHRARHERLLRASREQEANTLLAPQVGLADPSDRRHFSLIRCMQATLGHFPRNSVALGLQANYPRHGGARALALRAIVHRNFGCSHLLLQPDEPGATTAGERAEGGAGGEAERARVLGGIERVGVKLVQSPRLAYVKELMDFYPADALPVDALPLRLSDEDLDVRLEQGKPIPSWFSFPEVIHELRETHLPRAKQGFTVFFTGLSGAGKSTIANVLMVRLLETGGRPVTLLDGDIVRKNLSSELTFSKEHRDINIRRIGFVASKITKNGGIAVCAPIAPFASVRREVRELVSVEGGFVLVHVATSLEVCESRDRKGAYAKARAGIIKQFTGISDPYEIPDDAEVVIDTADTTPIQCAQQVILFLKKQGYLGTDDDDVE